MSTKAYDQQKCLKIFMKFLLQFVLVKWGDRESWNIYDFNHGKPHLNTSTCPIQNMNNIFHHTLCGTQTFVQKTCFEIRSTMHSWMKLIVDLHSPEPKWWPISRLWSTWIYQIGQSIYTALETNKFLYSFSQRSYTQTKLCISNSKKIGSRVQRGPESKHVNQSRTPENSTRTHLKDKLGRYWSLKIGYFLKFSWGLAKTFDKTHPETS